MLPESISTSTTAKEEDKWLNFWKAIDKVMSRPQVVGKLESVL
jgi:hypothetical protein